MSLDYSDHRGKECSVWIPGIEFEVTEAVTLELDVYVEGAIYKDYDHGILVDEYPEINDIEDVRISGVHTEDNVTYLPDKIRAMGWEKTILSTTDHGKKLRDRLIEQIENSNKIEYFMEG